MLTWVTWIILVLAIHSKPQSRNDEVLLVQKLGGCQKFNTFCQKRGWGLYIHVLGSRAPDCFLWFYWSFWNATSVFWYSSDSQKKNSRTGLFEVFFNMDKPLVLADGQVLFESYSVFQKCMGCGGSIDRHWYNMLFILAYCAFSLCCFFFFAEIMLKNMLFAVHYAKLF